MKRGEYLGIEPIPMPAVPKDEVIERVVQAVKNRARQLARQAWEEAGL